MLQDYSCAGLELKFILLPLYIYLNIFVNKTLIDLKYLEHGLAAGERTRTKSKYVSLALGPHGTAGWGEVKEGQSKAL